MGMAGEGVVTGVSVYHLLASVSTMVPDRFTHNLMSLLLLYTVFIAFPYKFHKSKFYFVSHNF